MKNKLLIFSAILFIGCGTTKKTSEETEIKKDSLYNKDKEFTLSTGNFTLKPFDPKKPMIIGKDTIVNTIIENHYRTEVIKEKDNGAIKVNLKQEKQSKEVDYSNLLNIAFKYILYLILILLIAMWLYRSFNPIELVKKLFKNKTPL